MVASVVCVATFGARYVVGFVVDGFEIPDGAVGKDDFFYLEVRSFLVSVVVVVAKVSVDSNFIIGVFNR